MARKRTVHVKGQPWLYRIGRDFVNVWSPEGKRYNPSWVDVWDVTRDQLKYYKGCRLELDPDKIRVWVENNLL